MKKRELLVKLASLDDDDEVCVGVDWVGYPECSTQIVGLDGLDVTNDPYNKQYGLLRVSVV